MSDSYTNTNTRSTTLNQTAAHDSGLYDPNRHDNQIVALYETEQHARAARDALIAASIPERAIRITDREQDRFVGGVDYEQNDGGLWGAIKSLFVPDEDAHGYAEGVSRGHAMLVVHPDATMDRHRIIEVLESTNPVDFDAKLEEWRQAGYSYPGSGATTGALAAGATGAAIGTGMATDTSSMRATDTTAAGTFRNAAPSGRPAATTRTTATPPAASTKLPEIAAVGAQGQAGDTIKVYEERLRVGKREIAQGAVRIRSYVVERPVEEQVSLHEERVDIERRPVNRALSPGEEPLFQERVIEARATGEEAVVAKEARVVEEIAVHKDATDRVETVRDTVRRTEVDVQDTTAGRDATMRAPAAARTPGSTPASTAGTTSSGTNAPRK